MKLIEYNNYRLNIADEALLVQPIRKLYNKDRSTTKESFMRQMSYLYFMTDPRSTYMYILDDKERAAEIIAQEGLPSDFKPSKELQEAMDIYKKHTITMSSELLNDTKITIDKLRKFLRDIDFSATDDKGRLLYPINQVTTALKQIPDLIKSLNDAEKAVTKELNEAGRARGGNESKTISDDGIEAFL